ncbi:hypothetical protein B1992_11785 [Pseudoxanthomonas broegbernensis]|uniref:Transmembrane protein n=1 Tax=Pseudoxanthomonas broegbernensis TaxID=83619 RepID=A0A7V8GKV7_9GAMM|nr:hypothetical protein [Pseudoxanthomonas broegbernensis]KAF1685419.1 hypothetical protein B1992_11785 [Pseudoxanthomonas broegbernensis]MBB6064453.1 hypothetical protein [Pseudoxanthomonas broegbernensis]
MSAYLANTWIRIGLALVVLGWGPLLAIIVLAAIGLWPDPNPNPIGPGLLFFFTFWPAIICLSVGVVRVRRNAAAAPRGPISRTATASAARTQPVLARLSGFFWVRLFVGLSGAGLFLYGLASLSEDSSRGPAASIVLGGVAMYWGFVGRVPSWFRR